MGASIAWHLARAGADVTLLFGSSKARDEATAYSSAGLGQEQASHRTSPTLLAFTFTLSVSSAEYSDNLGLFPSQSVGRLSGEKRRKRQQPSLQSRKLPESGWKRYPRWASHSRARSCSQTTTSCMGSGRLRS